MKTVTSEDIRVKFNYEWILYLNRISEYEKSKQEVAEKLNYLREAGLRDSENYRILLRELGNTISEEEVKFVSELHNEFPGSMFIPYNILYDLLDTFKLNVGRLSDFRKIIPNNIVEEMNKVNLRLKGGKLIDQINVGIRKIDYAEVLVSTKLLGRNLTETDVNEIVKMFRFPFSGIMDVRGREKVEIMNFPEDSIDFRLILNDQSYKGDRWFIIAPENDFEELCEVNIKVTNNALPKYEPEIYVVNDPMAIKLTKYGVIVFSKWIDHGTLEELNNWKV